MSSTSTSASTSSLRRAIAEEDTAGVIKTATALLDSPPPPSSPSSSSSSSVDVAVLTALVVALLQEQLHERVLTLAGEERYKAAFDASSSLSFCLAYALYKKKDLDACQALLRSSPHLAGGRGPPPPHVVHLQAQAHYKRGHFTEAAETYQTHFNNQQVHSCTRTPTHSHSPSYTPTLPPHTRLSLLPLPLSLCVSVLF
jgi:hypothetical protein